MKGPKKPVGAELRVLRDQRVQELTDPAAEAQRREASFLNNLSRAQNDFEWIVDNQAWIALGHESLADWWAAKVAPVMSALAMRPTRQVAVKVIAAIQEQEALLPRAQRRTKRELAQLVGTSEWTAEGRQDRSQPRPTAGADLENAGSEPSPLTAALTQAIQETEETAAERVHVYAPADGVETQPLRVDDAPAAGDAELRSASPAVTPQDSPAGQDHSSPDVIATTDRSEISHPYAGEAQDPHASEGSGAGATPSVVEERTALPGDVLPEVPASAYPPGSVPLDPAGEGPAAVLHAAGHPDPVMRLLDVSEQINEVCKLDAWEIAQLGDDSTFDALVLAGDEFAEFVLSVQHARVELSLDRRS